MSKLCLLYLVDSIFLTLTCAIVSSSLFLLVYFVSIGPLFDCIVDRFLELFFDYNISVPNAGMDFERLFSEFLDLWEFRDLYGCGLLSPFICYNFSV